MNKKYDVHHHEYRKFDFKDAKDYLQNKTNQDWGFITADMEHDKIKSVPRFGEKLNLKKMECGLTFHKRDADTLLFKFSHGGIYMVIYLLDRTKEWTHEYF